MPDFTNNLHNVLGGAAADQLRAYVKRIEVLDEEIAGLNKDKSEIYVEARTVGFCKKTMRKLIGRRKRDRYEVQEDDDLLLQYEMTLAAGEAEENL